MEHKTQGKSDVKDKARCSTRSKENKINEIQGKLKWTLEIYSKWKKRRKKQGKIKTKKKFKEKEIGIKSKE